MPEADTGVGVEGEPARKLPGNCDSAGWRPANGACPDAAEGDAGKAGNPAAAA